MQNTETDGQANGSVAQSADPWLATKTNEPVLSTAMDLGLTPVSMGPATGVVPLVVEKVACIKLPVFLLSTYCETAPATPPESRT